MIRDIAVHRLSHNVACLSSAAAAMPPSPWYVEIRIDSADGTITDVPLDAVPLAEAAIADAPAADDERLDITLSLGDPDGEMRCSWSASALSAP